MVGAGHAGTELMAALEELTRGILLRHYPSIPLDGIRLVLVGSAVLPQTATNLAQYTKERLLSRGIELERARAAKVSADGLALQDGRFIESHCVIWTAGNRVSPVVADLPLPKAKDGRLLVNEFFEVQGVRDVYALGDNAAQPGDQAGRLPRVVGVENGVHAEAPHPGFAPAGGTGLDRGVVLRARRVRADGG
ncbi:MAG: FAD-dependent oxidoreductase [Candidatus Rokubacteria bacterium]|nr:FAD-dependent oxidoreductase [Candidatus Rokubacteria bacterium]